MCFLFGFFNLSFNREWSFCHDLASKFDNQLSLFLGHLYLLLFDHVCCFLILLALHQFNPLVIQPQAMTQQATRHARRVYVGGLPPTANEQVITWIA